MIARCRRQAYKEREISASRLSLWTDAEFAELKIEMGMRKTAALERTPSHSLTVHSTRKSAAGIQFIVCGWNGRDGRVGGVQGELYKRCYIMHLRRYRTQIR